MAYEDTPEKSASILAQVAFKAAVQGAYGPDIANGDAEAIDRFESLFEFYKGFLFAQVAEAQAEAAPQRPAPATASNVVEILREEGMVDSQPQGGFKLEAANDQQGPWPTWLLQEVASLGIGKVWDNRKTATGNQPLFKEFVPKGQQGHGKGGEAKPFWAPKD